MLIQNLKPPTVVVGLILVILIGGTGIAELAASPPSLTHLLPKQNLFGIAAGLQTTTGSMLNNTKALQTKVDVVNQNLGQLSKQEQILNHQEQTGQQLATQLDKQQQLTQGGVQLMRGILSREKTTSTLTDNVSNRTTGLTSQVLQSETSLDHLSHAIAITNQQSVHLNSQMDALLAALDDSMQEFKAFGQVDKLLGGLLKSGAGLPIVGNSIGNSVGNAVGKTLGTTLGGLTGGLLK